MSEPLERFHMIVYGKSYGEGGRCDWCKRKRSVVWVSEMQCFRCSSCLAEAIDPVGEVRKHIVTRVVEEYGSPPDRPVGP